MPVPTPGRRDWREDEDGTPHLSYFAESTSFVWSGSAERPIQVCDGAAGELVTDTIWLPNPDSPGVMALPLALTVFKRACDDYLRERGA
jgi:hypothetical protein